MSGGNKRRKEGRRKAYLHINPEGIGVRGVSEEIEEGERGVEQNIPHASNDTTYKT